MRAQVSLLWHAQVMMWTWPLHNQVGRGALAQVKLVLRAQVSCEPTPTNTTKVERNTKNNTNNRTQKHPNTRLSPNSLQHHEICVFYKSATLHAPATNAKSALCVSNAACLLRHLFLLSASPAVDFENSATHCPLCPQCSSFLRAGTRLF